MFSELSIIFQRHSTSFFPKAPGVSKVSLIWQASRCKSLQVQLSCSSSRRCCRVQRNIQIVVVKNMLKHGLCTIACTKLDQNNVKILKLVVLICCVCFVCTIYSAHYVEVSHTSSFCGSTISRKKPSKLEDPSKPFKQFWRLASEFHRKALD